MQVNTKKKHSKWQLFKILFGKEKDDDTNNQECGCGCNETNEEVKSCCGAPEQKKLEQGTSCCGAPETENLDEIISCCAGPGEEKMKQVINCCGAPETESVDHIKAKLTNKEEYQGCGCGSTEQETSCCSSNQTDIHRETDTTLVMNELSMLSEKMYELSLTGSEILQAAEIQSHETVLELGSGGGTVCFQAARHVRTGGKVIGVEKDPAMVELAKANQKKLGFPHIEFYQGSMEQLPLPDESVDVIISCNMITMAPENYPGFNELYRVLKPGGRIFITDAMIAGDITREIRDILNNAGDRAAGLKTEEEYCSIIQKAGFINVGSYARPGTSGPCSCSSNDSLETGGTSTKTAHFRIIISGIRGYKPE